MAVSPSPVKWKLLIGYALAIDRKIGLAKRWGSDGKYLDGIHYLLRHISRPLRSDGVNRFKFVIKALILVSVLRRLLISLRNKNSMYNLSIVFGDKLRPSVYKSSVPQRFQDRRLVEKSINNKLEEMACYTDSPLNSPPTPPPA